MNRSLSLRVLRPAFRTGPTSLSALSRPSALVRFSPLSLQSKTSASSLTPSLFATRAYATSSKGDKDKGTGGKDAAAKSGDTAAKSDKPAFVDQQNLTSRAMDEVGRDGARMRSESKSESRFESESEPESEFSPLSNSD